MSFSSRLFPFAATLLAAVLFGGCAAVPPAGDGRDALYERREARLGQVGEWVLEGRLAISDAADGGSGALRWRHAEQTSRMDFHGALGRGAWQLEAGPAGAELTFADGRTSRADSVDALVRSEVGWQVPVESLAWWVRGLVAPGGFTSRSLDGQGLLSELRQDGWLIEFERYGAVGDEQLPMRVTARQDERVVKLAVRRWQLARPGKPDEPR